MIRRALLLVLYDLRVRRVIRWAMSDKAERSKVQQARQKAAVRVGGMVRWRERAVRRKSFEGRGSAGSAIIRR